MIARLTGKISEKRNDCVLVESNGLCYEVLVPPLVMTQLDNLDANATIKLITYHYFTIEQSKGIPILIGFMNEIEREFFEIFITVSGIGPRAAMKAINKPISLIAKAINEGNEAFLCSLPGIGRQRAKEIIAKLQNKMGKFGLVQDGTMKPKATTPENIVEEATDVLLQLQYKKQEAKAMIDKALDRTPGIKTTEDLLNEVYRQRQQ